MSKEAAMEWTDARASRDLGLVATIDRNVAWAQMKSVDELK